jgi:hypothetical protein
MDFINLSRIYLRPQSQRPFIIRRVNQARIKRFQRVS